MSTFGATTFGAAAQAGAAGAFNPNKDMEIVSPPTDGVSSLKFSPVAGHLVATSWDNQVRCWEVAANGQSIAKAAVTCEHPPLCCDWSADGASVYIGGCDNKAKRWDLATNQLQQVAQHDQPIRHLAFIPDMQVLVTGSWDKTLRYWDCRQPNPVHTQQLSDKCYALDVKHPLLTVGTADRKIQVFNLSNPAQPYKTVDSPLKFQTRVVTCFPDAQGYLVGSIEGRVAVQHIEEGMQSKNFTFKCHRDGENTYSVNDIRFHPVHHTFVTAGADGAYNFWDKDSKQRLKAMQKSNQPISCSAFNRDGTIYAYAVSYDWSRGYAEYIPATSKNYILLHSPLDAEVKSKPRAAATGRR